MTNVVMVWMSRGTGCLWRILEAAMFVIESLIIFALREEKERWMIFALTRNDFSLCLSLSLSLQARQPWVPSFIDLFQICWSIFALFHSLPLHRGPSDSIAVVSACVQRGCLDPIYRFGGWDLSIPLTTLLPVRCRFIDHRNLRPIELSSSDTIGQGHEDLRQAWRENNERMRCKAKLVEMMADRVHLRREIFIFISSNFNSMETFQFFHRSLNLRFLCKFSPIGKQININISGYRDVIHVD